MRLQEIVWEIDNPTLWASRRKSGVATKATGTFYRHRPNSASCSHTGEKASYSFCKRLDWIFTMSLDLPRLRPRRASVGPIICERTEGRAGHASPATAILSASLSQHHI